MFKLFSLVVTSLFLLACKTGPNFSSMTDRELAEYNMGVSATDQVHCFMRASTNSRVPRRVCETMGEVLGRGVSNDTSLRDGVHRGSVSGQN